MPYRVYAMDTYFSNSIGRYPFEVRCEMLAELGYDATYLTCWSEQSWKDVAKLPGVKAKYGLDVAGVYGVADLVAGVEPKLIELFETLEGCSTIEIAIKSAAGDDDAVKFLEAVLPVCQRRGLNLLLYPHINFFVERMSDAARLCERIRHPNLGAMFCGFHWYAIDDTRALGGSLATIGPYLRQVNLCGSRRDPNAVGGKATIEPLDDGEMDNFLILGHLRKIGYAEMVGFQGYSTGGDVYAKLKRALAAFRDMEARVERKPQWADHL